MRYRAKVTVATGGKVYGPGAILPEDISSGLMSFLRRKKFIEPLDLPPGADNAPDDGDSADMERDFAGFGMTVPETLKSPEEICRIRSKKEVRRYAESIGLDLGEDYEDRSLKDLQEEVVNFQEEQAADTGED